MKPIRAAFAALLIVQLAFGQTPTYQPTTGTVTMVQSGAKGDAIIVTDANITGGSSTLTTTSTTPFTCPTDAGKAIVVAQAGGYSVGAYSAALLSLIPLALVTTIATCVANNQVTLTAAAPTVTGIVTSLTYLSGITVTGTVGQTCALTLFNNGWTGGTGTVTLTATNTIAANTGIQITAQGSAASPAPTSATAGNGTATCSGTATVSGTLATNALTNLWMSFGTDDTAAARTCVQNGTLKGGQCYFNDDRIFMLSNTNTAIAVSEAGGLEGGAIGGKGQIVFAPAGSLIGGTNDRLFFFASSIGNSGCTSGGSGICAITNAPLAKGVSSFTTAAADGATITPGQWIIMEEVYSPGGCCNYHQWAKVSSVTTVAGTSTVHLFVPTEVAFPQDTNNSVPDVVGFRPVNNLLSRVTVSDITVWTPAMWDQSQGRRPNTFNTEGTLGLTIRDVGCWNVAKNCLATDYDSMMTLKTNYFHSEGTGTEVANSNHVTFIGNKFMKEPAAINGFASACAAGFSPSGLNVDLSTSFSNFSENQIEGCNVGSYFLQGSHDNTLAHNKYKWITAPGAGSGCILDIGGYNNIMIGNECPGGSSTSGNGILVEDSFANPQIHSANNQALFNVIGAFTTPYNFIGSQNLDCYTFLSGGAQLGTCFIGPNSNNTFTGANTFANGADVGYNPIILQSGLTADQITSIVYKDFTGAIDWRLEKDTTNGFRIHDDPNAFDWMQFSRGSGQAIFNSFGANNICFNCIAGSGTLGVVFGNGSSSTGTGVNAAGLGTFLGGLSTLQPSNGTNAMYAKRFTDTSPTGNMMRFQNAAANADLAIIDVTGKGIFNGGLDLSGGTGGLKLKDQGVCTMSSGTCSAQSLGHTYAAAPPCFATWNGLGTLTGLIKAPSTTTTVTPASSVGTDSAQVWWGCFGN